MIKIIKNLILAGSLFASSLGASELLFDLRAQDYANTLQKKVIVSKYKISDKIILETNLQKSKSGVYYYINDKKKVGFCNFEIKSELKNWTFNSNIIYQSFYKDRFGKNHILNKRRLIKLIDNSGNKIVLEFYYNGFSINGKEFKANINDAQVSLSIKNQNNKMIFKINGQKVYAINSSDFHILKNINTDILYYYKYDSINKFDRLHDLKLYSND